MNYFDVFLVVFAGVSIALAGEAFYYLWHDR